MLADAANTNAETAKLSAVSDEGLLQRDLADLRAALAAALAAKSACGDQLAITSTLMDTDIQTSAHARAVEACGKADEAYAEAVAQEATASGLAE